MPRGVLLEWHPVREVLVMVGWAKEKRSTWSLERQRPVAWGKPFTSTSYLWGLREKRKGRRAHVLHWELGAIDPTDLGNNC